MRTTRSKNLHPSWLLAPLLLSLILWLFIRQTTVLQVHPEVAWGVLVDLLLLVPLFFFFIVKKTKWPSTLTIPCIFLGVAIASNSLPEAQQGILSLVNKFGIPLIELGVFGFIIYQVLTNRKKFLAHWQQQPDFYSSVQSVFEEVLPGRLGGFLSTELSAFYYALFHWKKIDLKQNQFSYHKRSGTPALIGALIVMLLVEMFVVHLLIKDSYPIIALILLLLSGYSAFQFLGFAKALGKRPIQLNENMLSLRYGIMAEADLRIDSIEDIELITHQPKLEDELRFSPLGEMERVNVRLLLRHPVMVKGLYGKPKQTKSITLHLDKPTDFVKALNESRQRS